MEYTMCGHEKRCAITKKNQEPENPGRRDFLKSASRAAAVAGIAIGAVAIAPGDTAAAWDLMPKRWDETYDVVIIGSGFAGLAAALEAKKAGASVAILEKMRTPGGNSIINGGVISAAGSPLQADKGIKDSPDLLMADMITTGQGLNDPALVKIVAESSIATVMWTINELGVRYKDGLTQEGGHSVPRMYSTYNQSGSAIVNQQRARLKSMGQEIRTQAFLRRIYRANDGMVKGVQIGDGYVFPKTDSGTMRNIKAMRAVVMAHGGFAQDVIYRTIQDPRLTAKFESTNQPGATAECWREAFRIGCTPVQLDWIQVGPWTSPDEKGFGLGPLFGQLSSAMYGLWINTGTGKRFISELADRKARADAIMKLERDGQKCIAFSDANGIHPVKEQMPKLIERGVVRQFDSLEAMTAAYTVPFGPLREEVDRYNSDMEQGETKDSAFGRPIQGDAKPLGTPPFYAMRLLPKVHHCMGGVRINTRAQALDVTNDQPIPHLYAAGEATGGIHGAVRLGSCATLDCLTFGRIAGRNGAAEKTWVKGDRA
jgi:flavocytochrome c